MAKRSSSFTVTIQSETEMVFEGVCEALIVPTDDGSMAIMAEHTPMIAKLNKGQVFVRINKSNRAVAAITSGLLYVGENEASVLLDL